MFSGLKRQAIRFDKSGLTAIEIGKIIETIMNKVNKVNLLSKHELDGDNSSEENY